MVLVSGELEPSTNADDVAAAFDEDEPLVSPLLTVITVISGCVFDRQGAEIADRFDALFGYQDTAHIKTQKRLHRIFYRLLVPGFFILLRPSVNLLATSLTIDELLVLYEFAFETCLPEMTVIPVFGGILFGIFAMALKGAVSIVQVYFMAVFTSG